MIQVFRRGASVYEAARFKLRGLDTGAKYVITDVDCGSETRSDAALRSGAELAEKGLGVSINECPGAAVYVYRKAKP